MSAAEMKADLRDLYITAAKEVEVTGGKKAIVMFVPYRLLRAFHKIQHRLVPELEKKFSGRHVIIIADRTTHGAKTYARSIKTQVMLVYCQVLPKKRRPLGPPQQM